MNQNTKDKQSYAFSVTIENTATGESEVLQLPSTKEATKGLFDRLNIKRRYRIRDCDYDAIPQIRDAINRSINLDEMNYCAAELLKCDEEKIDFVWQVLESNCDNVYSAAEVINFLNSVEYSHFRISGVTTYEQVCEFHMAADKLKGFSPVHYIKRELYGQIGRELAHSERGCFFAGAYIGRTRNYYPDVYCGNLPEKYKIVPL